MLASISAFIYWTGNEVTVSVNRDGWLLVVSATEERIPELEAIIPSVADVMAGARTNWYEENYGDDPDLLRPDEVSGSDRSVVEITQEELERLEAFRKEYTRA